MKIAFALNNKNDMKSPERKGWLEEAGDEAAHGWRLSIKVVGSAIDSNRIILILPINFIKMIYLLIINLSK